MEGSPEAEDGFVTANGDFAETFDFIFEAVETAS
jgi:hypothetical protein